MPNIITATARSKACPRSRKRRCCSCSPAWSSGRRRNGSLSAEPPTVEATVWAFAVMLLSIVVDFFRARALYRIAKETSSEALEADALHFSSDMWSSLAVLIGLGGIALGYAWADSVAAIVVAVVHLHCRLAARPTHHRHADRHRAGRRRRAESPRSRDAHSRRGRDRTACACARPEKCCSSIWSLRSAARCRSIAWRRSRTGSSKPCAPKCRPPRSTVTTEPRALDDETVLERVMVIARNRALAVHHVTVHAIEGRLSISLDLEVDGSAVARRRPRHRERAGRGDARGAGT